MKIIGDITTQCFVVGEGASQTAALQSLFNKTVWRLPNALAAEREP